MAAWTRRRATLALAAGLALAAAVAAVAAASPPAHLAAGCTLETRWFGNDEQIGDTKDFSVKSKVTGAEPGPYSAQAEVTVHNPKVEICGGTISWYVGNGAGGQQSAAVTIGLHGGLSSKLALPAGADGLLVVVRARLATTSATPKTVAQCKQKYKQKYKHNKKARAACERRVRHKPALSSGCSLEARYSTVGETGDTKDLRVGFKAVGAVVPNQPATIQVEVRALNPKVTLCSTSLELSEHPSGTERTIPVPLGSHGGTSEPITIPANSIPDVKAVAKSG